MLIKLEDRVDSAIDSNVNSVTIAFYTRRSEVANEIKRKNKLSSKCSACEIQMGDLNQLAVEQLKKF